MMIIEKSRMEFERVIMNNNSMLNIAWRYNDIKNARGGTAHMRSATGATGAGHMRIIGNTRIAIAKETIGT